MLKNKIPLFPKFKQLNLIDKENVEYFTQAYLPYSDFNFASLWSYDLNGSVLLANLNNNLVVRFQNYITNQQFYSFIGIDRVVETADILLQHVYKENVLPFLSLIPEITINSSPVMYSLFNIKEDRNNFDYIHSVNHLAAQKNKEFATKRAQVNRFIKNNLNYSEVVLNLNDEKVKSEIKELFFLWMKTKDRDIKETQRELNALQKLIEYSHIFNLIAVGIYHKGKLIGFVINEIVNQQYSMGHFMKADSSYIGIFEILHKFIAIKLAQSGCSYINAEQDLGILGLRHAKELWHPVNFLKKYTISRKK